MHNNIMAAGSKDRPPMLGPGRYSQWRSRFLRLFDILKQFQKEVNDIRAERIAKSANPLALLAAAQPYSDTYYQAPKPQRSNATSSSTRQSASTRHKGKEVAKPITPQSESVSEEDSDPEQAQRDKEMQKNLALLAKYFKKLYKPTNNNLRTSSNSRNKTEDTTPRYNNDNQSRQFGNQRTMTVAGARETVGSQVVQQTGIQCFNCKGYGHYAKECRKPKRVKDYAYHKEKMMMCKQAEQGVPLQAEQADWLEDTDEEIDEQELEAHYSYMAKIQEVSPEESSSTGQPLEQVQNHDESNVYDNVRRHSEQPESINDTYVLEKDDSNVTPDSSNICTNDNQVDQNAVECVDERDALANLIANLTLDTEENKTILKQLKKANASLTQELEKCKTNLDETNSALGEAISCRDSCLIALQNKQNEFEKYKAFNDRTIDYEILQTKLNETLGLLALKDIEIKEGLKTKAYEISVLDQKHDDLVKKSLLTKSQLEGYLKENTKVISDLKVKEEKDIDKMIEMDKQLKFLNEIVYTRNQSIQTIHMLAPKCATYNGRLTFANPRYLKKAQSEKPCLYEIPYDNSDHANRFAPEREETMTLENESRSKLNKDKVKPYDYTNQNSLYEIFKGPSLEYLYQLERAKEVRKTMWRKPFVRTKPNIAKNVAFLPVSKSISKRFESSSKERHSLSVELKKSLRNGKESLTGICLRLETIRNYNSNVRKLGNGVNPLLVVSRPQRKYLNDVKARTKKPKEMLSDQKGQGLAPQRQEMSVAKMSLRPRSQEEGIDLMNHLHQLLAWTQFGFSSPTSNKSFPIQSDGRENGILNGHEGGGFMLLREGFVDQIIQKNLPSEESFVTSSRPDLVACSMLLCTLSARPTQALIETEPMQCLQPKAEYGVILQVVLKSEYQFADMFTKAFLEARFKYLVRRIGMRCLTPAELEAQDKRIVHFNEDGNLLESASTIHGRVTCEDSYMNQLVTTGFRCGPVND
ncbi:integrase, catalytic region, zinc finger, CCHC-type containing protein [Tanacetum coccineum]